jgi:predicted methyltransferase
MNWLYQVRFNLDESNSKVLRSDDPSGPCKFLNDILATHNATAICQYDAFSDYCREAEANNKEDYSLYEWTLTVINDPIKIKKYTKNFTVYVADEQLYKKAIADEIFRKLLPLPFVTNVIRYDNNPKNSPQPHAGRHIKHNKFIK